MNTLAYVVSDRRLADQYTAVMRAEIPRTELAHWLATVYPKVREYLRRVGVKPVGPPFARYTYLGKAVAVEAGYPVPGDIPGDGTVVASTLPDGRAAVTTHWGPHDDLDRAYAAVRRWLLISGRAAIGARWEVYHTNPVAEPDPTRWRTDVVVPYRIG